MFAVKQALLAFNKINVSLGKLISWLVLIMVITVFGIVILRYVFSVGWIWLQELVTWMHAVVFLLTAGYTLSEDAHVRVDVLYRRWSKKTQQQINFFGSLFCLCPVSLFLFFGSLDYVDASWTIKEASKDAGGLDYPFIPLLKTAIPISGILLFIQGLFIAYKSIGANDND
jgi:TRAP-type mannitol/chloroaromatic compound transport system permease small subunit